MALYRGSTKLAGIGNGFSPSNTGTTGQVLTKTAGGYQYEDAPVTSINGSTGAIILNDVKVSSTAPANPTAGMVRLDTNDAILKYYDNGWVTVTRQYFAGTGIDIDLSNTIYNNGVTSVNSSTGDITINEVPSGGTDGQVLSKVSGSVAWANPSGGGKFVDIMLVGGGGGGGHSRCYCYSGGGGAGGGVLECYRLPITKNSESIIVGAGGYGGAGSPGGVGGCSKFGNVVVYGGGGGGGGGSTTCNGGSGANLGGGWQSTSPSIARTMGIGGGNLGGWTTGGGGAGAGGSVFSKNYCCSQYGRLFVNGGPGKQSKFSGTVQVYSGGGGGAGGVCCVCGYGCDGGGDINYCGCKGTCCGSGGGASMDCSASTYGGAGACGIVYVRYPSDGSYGITSATGGTKTSVTVDGTTYCLHTFTSSGTFTIVS